jgi:hypothetical protein
MSSAPANCQFLLPFASRLIRDLFSPPAHLSVNSSVSLNHSWQFLAPIRFSAFTQQLAFVKCRFLLGCRRLNLIPPACLSFDLRSLVLGFLIFLLDRGYVFLSHSINNRTLLSPTAFSPTALISVGVFRRPSPFSHFQAFTLYFLFL